MWEPLLPPEGDLLRQGDLVKGVMLPRLRLPLEVAHVPGTNPEDGAVIPLKGYARDFLIVSQCCEIENGAFVSLALIRSTGPLNEALREGLQAEQPPSPGEEGGFVFDQFRLDPLDHLVEEPDYRYTVADLGQIISFGGQREDLNPYRQARMTPEGRRLLRIKLTYYFGRAENDDANHLEERGIPIGARQ